MFLYFLNAAPPKTETHDKSQQKNWQKLKSFKMYFKTTGGKFLMVSLCEITQVAKYVQPNVQYRLQLMKSLF